MFLALFIGLAKISGLSFGNLFFGPQHEGTPFIPRTPPPPPTDGQVITAFKEKAWWLTEYKTLNAALDKAGGNLSFSYRSGPGGDTTVNLKLERGPGNALTLIVDSPPQAFKSLNEKTGRLVTDDYRTTSKFRDTDLDGMPDEAFIEPAGEPLYPETLTRDGYIRVRDSTDHTALFMQWTIGIAVATNRFLHGKESVLP
jgi:hypothetical protein